MNKLKMFAAAVALFSGATSATAAEDVTPNEAYDMVAGASDVYILDVRSEGEWKWVGHPGSNDLGEGSELDGKVVNISYKIDYQGDFVINPSFLSDVEELFGENPDAVLITMCRSGSRSLAAAAELEDAGYQVKNMVTGFEGSKDTYGYRTVNGWANDGLPYNHASTGGYSD